jgi:hypothetical protein
VKKLKIKLLLVSMIIPSETLFRKLRLQMAPLILETVVKAAFDPDSCPESWF